MSELSGIEQAMVNLITPIPFGSGALFSTVKGYFGDSGRDIVLHLRRERKPAVYVVYERRDKSSGFGVADEPLFSVFVVVESFRGDSEPRIGTASVAGGFDVLEKLHNTLAGAIIVTDRQLLFVDERTIDADDKSVVYEQRYGVQRLASVTSPTFRGSNICGANSIGSIVVGDLRMDRESFSFPGIGAEYQQVLGNRGRSLVWRGQLREASEVAMNSLESSLESMVSGCQVGDLTDGFGRTFKDCVLQKFSREGNRKKNPITGQVLQSFELLFVQLRS